MDFFSRHLCHERIVFGSRLGPQHDVLADQKKIVLVAFSLGKRGHAMDLPNGGHNVSWPHGDRPVLFPTKDHKGALRSLLFCPMLSDNVEGGGKENEFLFRIDVDLACRGVGIGVLIEREVPDKEVASRRAIIAAKDLSAENGDSSIGERFVGQDLGELVRLLACDKGCGLRRKLVGAGGQGQSQKAASDHS
jgi:hypothetical protein